jgi:hypothetical protein
LIANGCTLLVHNGTGGERIQLSVRRLTWKQAGKLGYVRAEKASESELPMKHRK